MYFKIIVYMKSFIIYFMNTNNAHYLALKTFIKKWREEGTHYVAKSVALMFVHPLIILIQRFCCSNARILTSDP